MADTFTVEGRFGRVELEGEGPWQVHQLDRYSWSIVDIRLRPARPTIWNAAGTKSDQNVIWRNSSLPAVIVAAANEIWANR